MAQMGCCAQPAGAPVRIGRYWPSKSGVSNGKSNNASLRIGMTAKECACEGSKHPTAVAPHRMKAIVQYTGAVIASNPCCTNANQPLPHKRQRWNTHQALLTNVRANSMALRSPWKLCGKPRTLVTAQYWQSVVAATSASTDRCKPRFDPSIGPRLMYRYTSRT